MTLPTIIRDQIRARLAAGETISELARNAGVERATLSRFVAEKRDVTTEIAGKLLESLGGKVVFKKVSKK